MTHETKRTPGQWTAPQSPRQRGSDMQGIIERFSAATSFDDLVRGDDEIVHFDMPPLCEFFDKELIETAKEFFNAGILKLPFERVAIHTDYAEPGTILRPLPSEPKVKMLISEGDGDSITEFIFFGASKNAAFNLMFPPFTYAPGSEEFSILTREGMNKVGLRPVDYLSENNRRDVGEWLRDSALLCLLVISMPQFEKVEIERPESLQAARAKRGRPRLPRLIQIRLRPELRVAYEGEAGRTGDKKRPHWRRGHLRRLSAEKIVPVAPCMVNFNGDSIERRNYRLEK